MRPQVGGANSLDTWQRLIEPERQHSRRLEREDEARFTRLLKGREDYGLLLQETYSGMAGANWLDPAPVCRGCPECRDHPNTAHAPARSVGSVELAHASRLKKLVRRSTSRSGDFFPVFYDSRRERSRRSVVALADELVRRGLPSLHTDASWMLRDRQFRRWSILSHAAYIAIGRPDELEGSLLARNAPCLTVLSEESALRRQFDPLMDLDLYAHVLVFDLETRDRSRRRVIDVYPNVPDVQVLLETLEQSQ